MFPYILSAIIFCVLLGALLYADRSASYEAMRKKTTATGTTTLLVLLLLAVSVFNFIFLNISPLEGYIAALLLWFGAIFFILLLQSPKLAWSFLVAGVISEAMILGVYKWGEYANNIPLLIGLVGAVVLLIKTKKISEQALVWLIVFMAAINAVFLWLVPVIPSLDASLQPLQYSLLLKVGSISLGAGDIVLSLVAMLLLAKSAAWPVRIFYAFVLSQCVTIAFLISTAGFFSGNIFPFTLVLAPVFLLLYTTRRRNSR